MNCAIVMERVLIFNAALSFRHAPRATSLSEGGSIAPHCVERTFFSRAFKERPYNHAALCEIYFFKHLIHHCRGPPVSLRLGHARALIRPRRIIHHPRAALLPAGEGKRMLRF